jgi:Wiskott-Aldrich syndrome protein
MRAVLARPETRFGVTLRRMSVRLGLVVIGGAWMMLACGEGKEASIPPVAPVVKPMPEEGFGGEKTGAKGEAAKAEDDKDEGAEVVPETPAAPGAKPGAAAAPATPGAKPGAAPGAKPGAKPATPATPATPGAKPATPATPATPGAKPATPATPPAKPATPATPPSAKPPAPAKPGAAPPPPPPPPPAK